MKTLKELLYVNTIFRPDHTRSSIKKGRDTAFQRFVQGIESGKYRNDSDALRDIYGENQSVGKFRTLKSRVRARLIHVLFSSEIYPEYSSPAFEIFYRAHKDLFYARVLMTLGAKITGANYAAKALTLAELHHLTDIQAASARLLRQDAFLRGDLKRMRHFGKMERQFMRAVVAESAAEQYTQRLLAYYIFATVADENILALAHRYMEIIDRLRERYQTLALELFSYRIRAISLQAARDYRGTLRICLDAIAYLQRHPHNCQRLHMGEFRLKMVVCYRLERNLARVAEQVEICREIFREGHFNWFTLTEQRLLLALHQHDISGVRAIYQEAVQHPCFDLLPDHKKEPWIIYKLYIPFIDTEAAGEDGECGNGMVLCDESDPKRLSHASHDKCGLNLARLIACLLSLLDKGAFDRFIDRLEPLRVYSNRYLRNPRSQRSFLFIKMLTLLERHSFLVEAIEPAARQYRNCLLPQGALGRSLDDAEIIPYEHLWDWVLARLKPDYTPCRQ